MNYTNYKLTCSKCGKRILVEVHLNGTNHNMGVSATCADCIKAEDIPAQFRKQEPEAVRLIEEWLKEGVK